MCVGMYQKIIYNANIPVNKGCTGPIQFPLPIMLVFSNKTDIIGVSIHLNSYFPFQPVVHNWFIKGRGMYCSVYGKVHIKDPLLLIEKSSLCGGSGFPSKKCVNVTI